MAELRGGEFIRNETNTNAMGGTERMTLQLLEKLGKEELADFQIVSSRVRDLDGDKIRIYWAHDLPGDPESKFLADKNKQQQFHKYVFVSNWQMQGFMQQYGIPWSKCIVINNAIDKFPEHTKPDPSEQINLIYHSTPHRGLNILTAVFERLSEKFDNLHLDVFSSFRLYGWAERDEQYKPVFDKLRSMPNVTNHGTVDNLVIRDYLERAHVFAYPSIWPETSCLCLMEAMAAGLVCIHSNYGALYETAASLNQMYQMHEDQNAHASILYSILEGNLENIDAMLKKSASAASYANLFYSWDQRKFEWRGLLKMLKNQVTDRSLPKESFFYNTNG